MCERKDGELPVIPYFCWLLSGSRC